MQSEENRSKLKEVSDSVNFHVLGNAARQISLSNKC